MNHDADGRGSLVVHVGDIPIDALLEALDVELPRGFGRD